MNEYFENEHYCRKMISRLALGMLAGALIIQVAATIVTAIMYKYDSLTLLDKNSDIILSAVCVYCVGMPLTYLILKDMRHVHPHKFRRTLATMAIDKGMPIEQLQKLLGHKRIDTTLHYAMVKQSNVKTAHRKFIG